jgi:hypothetical protein
MRISERKAPKNPSPQSVYSIETRRREIMAKGQNQKKTSKKKPLKTLKEKRRAKREKKNQSNEKIIKL